MATSPMQTSIRYLKDHLSEILRNVSQGEEVHITSHRCVIAKIIPLPNTRLNPKEDKHTFVQQLQSLHAKLKLYKPISLSKAILDARREALF